jgi:hypothetical protein
MYRDLERIRSGGDIPFPAQGVGKCGDLWRFLRQRDSYLPLTSVLAKKFEDECGLPIHQDPNYLSHAQHFRFFALAVEIYGEQLLTDYVRDVVERPVFRGLLQSGWRSSADVVAFAVQCGLFNPPFFRFCFPYRSNGFVTMGFMVEHLEPRLDVRAYAAYQFLLVRELAYRLTRSPRVHSQSAWKIYLRNGLLNGSYKFPLVAAPGSTPERADPFQAAIQRHQRTFYPALYLAKSYGRLFVYGLASQPIASNQWDMLQELLNHPDRRCRFPIDVIKSVYWGQRRIRDGLLSVNVLSEASKRTGDVQLVIPDWDDLPALKDHESGQI